MSKSESVVERKSLDIVEEQEQRKGWKGRWEVWFVEKHLYALSQEDDAALSPEVLRFCPGSQRSMVLGRSGPSQFQLNQGLAGLHQFPGISPSSKWL